MAKGGIPKELIEHRRTRVMALRLAGNTQRDIQRILGDEGIVNPTTGEPFSLGTINSDIKVIRGEWSRRRSMDVEAWVDEENAKIDELERFLWASYAESKKAASLEEALAAPRANDVIDMALKIQGRRAALLGLDAMTRHKMAQGDKVALELSPEAVKVIEEMGISLATVRMQFEALLKNTRGAVV